MITGYVVRRRRAPAQRAADTVSPRPRSSQVRNYQWHAEVVCELDVLTDAWNLARRRALDRLAEEALQVGADAVVGVHLRRSDHDLGQRTIEYVVTGTAIRLPGLDRDSLRRSSPTCPSRTTGGCTAPGTSRSGWWPRPPSCSPRRRATPGCAERGRRTQNQELEELSQGFHAAREAVRARLRGPGLRRPRRPARSGSSSRTRCTARSSRWPRRCRPATTAAGSGAGSACPTASRAAATPSAAAG